MITLALDAATYVGTVAVFADDRLLAEREAAMRGRDAERLMPAVSQALADAGVRVGQVQRVVCGNGPGSFTSLRIAASIAKGIAMGCGAELFQVSSLGLIPAGATTLEPGPYLGVLDALRGEAYFQRFRRERSGAVVPESRFYLGSLGAVLRASTDLGATIAAPADVLSLLAPEGRPAPEGAVVLTPHARGVARLAGAIDRADLTGWEPHYGRLAEAQMRWEAHHGRPLPSS